ncbi:TRAP transporter substrate-binding protein DctP [Lysobacter fragariae]
MNRLFAILLLSFAAIAPASAQQVIRIATIAPEGSAWMKELRVAAAEVQAGTQGRVQVKYFPAGVMGNDSVVLRKMKLGQLQGGVLTSSELGAVYPDAVIYSLPFFFDTWSQVDRARAKVDPVLSKGFEGKGLKLLATSNVGFAFLMSTHPVKSHADAMKAKLWVPANDEIAIRTFKAGGVSPTPLPLGDVFTSLQTGLVDTVANTPSGAVAMQWNGKIKHMVDLPLSFVVGYMVMDLKAFNKLTPADQAVASKAFTAAGKRLDVATHHDNDAALAAMRKQGLTVGPLDPSETARWRKVGEIVANQMSADGSVSPSLVTLMRKAANGTN